MSKKRNFEEKSIVIGKDFWESGVTPPMNEDLEKAVLGAVLLESAAIHQIGADFNPGLFFKLEHKIIAATIIEMFFNKQQIDIVTVTSKLKNDGKLQEIGGPSYIARLTNYVASTANLETHVKILQEMFLSRFITELCAKTMQKTHEPQADVFEIYADLQHKLDNAIKEVIHFEVQSIGEINRNLLREQVRVAQEGNPPGVVTGMKRVDKVTNGWQKSDLVILAGRPGMGKTAFVVSCIMEPSINVGKPVAIFSLEMSKDQLVGRIQSQITGINVSRVTKKQLTIDEANVGVQLTSILNDAPIYIDDTAAITLIELRSKARKLVYENGVELIIIDYLQLMRSGMGIMNREQEIAEISRGLKAMAKELDVPVIALSQLSRKVEERGDKKPVLSDLRESGQIEQDADMVIFCYRPEYYGAHDYEIDGDNYDAKGLFMLLIAKHRNGSLGEIPLSFIHDLARIKDHTNDNPNQSYTFVKRGQENDVMISGPTGMKPNTSFELPPPQEFEGDDYVPF